MFEHPPKIRLPFAKMMASLAVHCGILALLVHHGHSKPVRVVLAGTAAGSHVELTYQPGPARSLFSGAPSEQGQSKQAQPRQAQSKPAQPVPVPTPVTVPDEEIKPSAATLRPPPPRPHLSLSQTSTALSNVPASVTSDAASDAAAGSDSVGSGNIQIALTTYSPSPKPDLSQLPRGVQGDVVLDVTIDPSGKVAEVAVVRAMGYGIDEAVIDTVRTWLFHPATKDGVPVSSAQDVLFHFGPA